MIMIISFFGLILSGGWAYDELDCSGVREVSRDREIRIKKSHLVNGKCKIRYFRPEIDLFDSKLTLFDPKLTLFDPKSPKKSTPVCFVRGRTRRNRVIIAVKY